MGPQGYTFHVFEPAYKDHLCISATFSWSLGCMVYTFHCTICYCGCFPGNVEPR